MPFLIILFIILIVTSTYPVIVLYGAACFFLIYKFFWKENQPKTIFFGLLMFWLSVIIKLVYCDLTGRNYKEYTYSWNIVEATVYSFNALLFFSLGVYL